MILGRVLKLFESMPGVLNAFMHSYMLQCLLLQSAKNDKVQSSNAAVRHFLNSVTRESGGKNQISITTSFYSKASKHLYDNLRCCQASASLGKTLLLGYESSVPAVADST